jgi:hypothetical protein
MRTSRKWCCVRRCADNNRAASPGPRHAHAASPAHRYLDLEDGYGTCSGCTAVYLRVMPKVMVSLPQDLLDDLDREAARLGDSRSAVLQRGARRELGRFDPAELDTLLQRARDALAPTGAFESADLVRAERDQ